MNIFKSVNKNEANKKKSDSGRAYLQPLKEPILFRKHEQRPLRMVKTCQESIYAELWRKSPQQDTPSSLHGLKPSWQRPHIFLSHFPEELRLLGPHI